MANTDYNTGPVQLNIWNDGINGTTSGGTVPITPTVYPTPTRIPYGDPDMMRMRPYPHPSESSIMDELGSRINYELERMGARLFESLRDELNQSVSRLHESIASLEDLQGACLANQHRLETQYAILTKTLSDLITAIKETGSTTRGDEDHDTERGRCAGEGGEERPVLYGGCNQGSSPVGFSDAVRDGVLGEIPGYDPSAVSGAV